MKPTMVPSKGRAMSRTRSHDNYFSTSSTSFCIFQANLFSPKMIPGFPYGGYVPFRGYIGKISWEKLSTHLWLVLCYPGDFGHLRGALYVSWLITWWTSHVMVTCSANSQNFSGKIWKNLGLVKWWNTEYGTQYSYNSLKNMMICCFPSSIFDSNWFPPHGCNTPEEQNKVSGNLVLSCFINVLPSALVHSGMSHVWWMTTPNSGPLCILGVS